MKKFITYRLLPMFCAIAVALSSAFALDLPVMRVKGKQYYYYTVKKGESIYGLAKTLGLTREEIIRHNPAAADGIKKGDMLTFPFEEYSERDATDYNEPGTTDLPDLAGYDDDSSDEFADEADAIEQKNTTIAVLLPLGLNGGGSDNKRNKLALDFYKGFLLGTEKHKNSVEKVSIVVRDIEGLGSYQLNQLVTNDKAIAGASIIIVPDDDASIRAISSATAKGTYVLNTLNTRDSTYLSHPGMMQANIPQRRMYELAAEALMEKYPEHIPVIISSADGKNEKAPFTEYVAEQYGQKGITPKHITYKQHLLMADLEALQTANGEKYVIIPSSGTLAEFNKFAYTFKSFRDKQEMLRVDLEAQETEGTPVEIEIFGYPDWTAYRGDALDTLHRINATVYSRFMTDSADSSNVGAEFKKWYGTSYIEGIPAYGLLGYDSACYLFTSLKLSHNGIFEPLAHPAYAGVQSNFSFKHSGKGFVNDSLYIIEYLAGDRTAAYVK